MMTLQDCKTIKKVLPQRVRNSITVIETANTIVCSLPILLLHLEFLNTLEFPLNNLQTHFF